MGESGTFASVLKKNMTIIRCCMAALLCLTAGRARGEEAADADTLGTVEVVAPLSRDIRLDDLSPVAHTTVRMHEVERLRVLDVKELSALVPGLHIPDYGSRMTSSVYIRGLGSRIDQPAMGVYVDGIPLLNKNTYDFRLPDVRSIAVLRGPQNTLYGRNAMGGVIDIKTLSPLTYEGTRLMVEGGNGNSWRGRASTYHRIRQGLGYSVSAQGDFSDGFYTNTYKDARCDWSRSAGLNLRLEGEEGGSHWNLISALDWVNQGGFPYRMMADEGGLQPVSYNDHCGYHRLIWRLGASCEGLWGGQRYMASTSYQFSTDEMQMDQDFTPLSMFTLKQAQRDHTLNQDFTLRPAKVGSRWEPLTGVNLWFRNLATSAPVLFREDGIQRLILDNANAGIQTMSPLDTLSMEGDRLPIPSEFVQRYYGLSLYHHSIVNLGEGWKIGIGGRVEYEGQRFDYNSHTEACYRIASPDGNVERTGAVELKGCQRANYFEWAPTASLTYNHGGSTWHLAAGRGFKAGGFNTQLFSDLVQQMLTAEIMSNYIHVADDIDVRRTTRYKPEHSWNVDVGYKWQQGGTRATLTAYYTDVRDQQLTVFPDGMQTGRMMANAGHSRIWGIEAEAGHRWERLSLQAAYGYTHATFADYLDGPRNYCGNRIPYVPEHTLMVGADWNIALGSPHWGLLLHADTRGTGKRYWDEENRASQPFYALLNASARLSYDNIALTLWGRNLTDTRYSTFYFVSMKNRFLQQGKPLQCGATITWSF